VYLNLLFQEGSFPKRVDRVADAGLGGIEAYGVNLNHGTIARRVAEHNLKWVCLSGKHLAFTDPDNHETAIESIEDSLTLAVEHGIQPLNVKSGETQEGLYLDTQRESVIAVLEEVALSPRRRA